MGILTFKDAFDKHRKKFAVIRLNEKDIHNCVSYIRAVVKKEQNTTKLTQNNQKYKDMFLNVCVITAISNRIGYPIMDYKRINTDPIDQFRELVGKWFDVIVFNYNEFPIFYHPIHKKAIFVCKLNDKDFILCGFGTNYVINSFHSKSLIENYVIREQSTMSAFYGFEHLKSIPNNIYDFKNLTQ
jgi:hypothetical protein